MIEGGEGVEGAEEGWVGVMLTYIILHDLKTLCIQLYVQECNC